MLGIEDLVKEFPAAIGELRILKTKTGGFMSTTYGDMIPTSINFTPGFFNFNGRWGIQGIYMGTKTGLHPQNTGLRESGTHEFGHVIEVFMSKRKASGGWFSYMEQHRYSHNVLARALSAIRKDKEHKWKTDDELILEISEYASENSNECLSEAVADYMRNKNNAAPLSREIWKILKKDVR